MPDVGGGVARILPDQPDLILESMGGREETYSNLSSKRVKLDDDLRVNVDRK